MRKKLGATHEGHPRSIKDGASPGHLLQGILAANTQESDPESVTHTKRRNVKAEAPYTFWLRLEGMLPVTVSSDTRT